MLKPSKEGLVPLKGGDLLIEEGTDPAGRAASAVFDPGNRYRYELRRGWYSGHRKPRTMVICGCNPSIATALVSDHTVNRCCYYAQREGCSKLVMVNAFAMITMKPGNLVGVPDPVGGPLCDEYIRQAVAIPDALVVLAWGNVPRKLEWRADQVASMIMQMPVDPPVNFGLTHRGHPKHPCRLGNNARLTS